MATGLGGWMATRPRLVDVLVAVAVFVLSLLAVPATPETVGLTPPPLTGPVVALLALACTALLWRRSHPVLVWLVTVVATVVPLPTGTVGRGLPAAIAALYAVAAYGTRRAAVAATVVTMAVVLVLLSRSGLADAQDPIVYAVVAWCALAAALGDAVRSNRAVIRAALERARRAEEGRDAEAARRVAEERLRISRELHDVVAHHVAVVNVQAGVAEHLVATDPPAAAEALSRVREAARTALREMAGIVGLLRLDPGSEVADGNAVPPPAPGAEQIPALVAALRASGVEVGWSHEGPPLHGTLSDDLQLYRVLQEALTNAARHGTGHVRLRTIQAADSVTMEVENEVADAATTATSEGGHGLLGMRERMAVVGGDLEAGPGRDGTFVVRARFPVVEP